MNFSKQVANDKVTERREKEGDESQQEWQVSSIFSRDTYELKKKYRSCFYIVTDWIFTQGEGEKWKTNLENLLCLHNNRHVYVYCIYKYIHR